MTPEDDALEDRKKSQEARYKMEEERRFKARSRRDKLAGLWAAGRLGLDAEAARELAGQAVMIGFEARADADFARRLAESVAALGGGPGAAEIAAELPRLAEEAKRQIALEFPAALDTDHGPVGDGPFARRR
jgi:hypothetical protein